MDLFVRAATEALWASRSVTANDAPPMRGWTRWNQPIRTLSDELVPLGWKRRDERNSPLLVDPTGRHGITVATGSRATGDPRVSPRTERAKGPVIAGRIRENQLRLWGDDDVTDTDELAPLVWILLIHENHETGHMQAELSLPEGMDELGRVSTWRERILLPTVEGPSGLRRDLSAAPSEPVTDIEVRPKSLEA